jgi:hypothetical protein
VVAPDEPEQDIDITDPNESTGPSDSDVIVRPRPQTNTRFQRALPVTHDWIGNRALDL